jgi:hypothetical protein
MLMTLAAGLGISITWLVGPLNALVRTMMILVSLVDLKQLVLTEDNPKTLPRQPEEVCVGRRSLG